jgi:hypothetical protein
VRCQSDLGYGVEFDHIDLWANSRDSSADNCAAVCPRCHRFKSTKHDTPKAAKTVRQSEMGTKLRETRNPLPGSKRSGWKKKMSGEVVRR